MDAELKQGSLSKGEEQLLGVARALLGKGNVVVMDEALSSVDEVGRVAVERVLREGFTGRMLLVDGMGS